MVRERQDFTLALTEPYFLDRRLSLGGELFYREASFLSVEYNQREYGISILREERIRALYLRQRRISVTGGRYLRRGRWRFPGNQEPGRLAASEPDRDDLAL